MDGPFGVFPAPVLYPTIGFFSNPRISPIVSLIDCCFFKQRLRWATAIDASPSLTGWEDRAVKKGPFGGEIRTTQGRVRWFLIIPYLGGCS